MLVLKAAPGLDPDNILGRLLGDGFTVSEFDQKQPLERQVRDAAVLILRDVPIPASVIDAAPKLRLLQRYGQHLVGVDIPYARSKGIWIARAPVAVTEADRVVAEHALFLMLAVAKRYPECIRTIAQRVVGRPTVYGLVGKTLGLVGLGKTGTELAPMAKALGMRVIAVKRSADPELARRLGLEFIDDMGRYNELLETSDFVSIHLPLETGTVGFFGRDAFRRMKPGSFLINIARGPIVDKAALVEALASKHLAGAGLDVFWEEPIDPNDPVLKFPNVVATPHIAGATYEMQERLAAIVAENIRRVAVGQPPAHQVA